MGKKICVIGSSNIDQFSYVNKFPQEGETIIGESFKTGFGGKGANQAVMAGILGSDVYIISCLGNDIFAESTIDNFKKNKVNTEYIQRADVSSGVAPIWVDSDGENKIVVIPGANNEINAEDAINSIKKIENVSYVVGQAEIPMKVNDKVFQYSKSNNILTIFNPAPGMELEDKFLDNVDWLIPNEYEFEIISGLKLSEENILDFSSKIYSNLIVTLGKRGAFLVEDNNLIEFGAPTVLVADTTGAGDAFVGTFVHGLSENLTAKESIKLAIEKASSSVQRKGTQSSYSSSSE